MSCPWTTALRYVSLAVVFIGHGGRKVWRSRSWSNEYFTCSLPGLYLTFSTTPKGQKRPAYYNYIPYILTIFILSLTAAYLSFPTV